MDNDDKVIGKLLSQRRAVRRWRIAAPGGTSGTSTGGTSSGGTSSGGTSTGTSLPDGVVQQGMALILNFMVSKVGTGCTALSA